MTTFLQRMCSKLLICYFVVDDVVMGVGGDVVMGVGGDVVTNNCQR